MSLRLPPFVQVSALALAALHCKSADTAPSKSADAYREPGRASSEALPSLAMDPDSEGCGESSSGQAEARDARRPSLSDAQIVAVTDAANSAQIAQGRLAQQKASDPRVRDFAAMMIDHHGEARDDRQKLRLEPAQSSQSRRLQDDAEEALKSLQHESGKAFDRAYLQLQIDEHREVLEALSEQLLPSAKDSALKAYLEQLEPRLESHLAQAERLQEELNGTSTLSDAQAERDRGRPLSSNTHGSGARRSNR